MCQGISRHLGISVNKTKIPGNSLAIQWLGLGTFTARALVQFLVRELRSRKLSGTAKTKKKQKTRKISAPVKFTCILAKETSNKHNK